MRRFKELQRDFTSDDRYKTRNINTHLEEEPEHELHKKALVHKLMTDNVIINEDTNNLFATTKKKQVPLDPKVEAILLKNLDKLNEPKHFEKMTSLLGITRGQYIATQSFEQFYKSR
jgi:hypothetical protein